MICFTHTHQIVAFEMEITFTDSTTETSVSIYTLSTKWSKREDDIGRTPAFSFGYPCSCSSSDYDRKASLQCAVMTENECRITFNVVARETQTTAYDLQMYGKVTARQLD